VKEVRSFLGFGNFFRKFIEHFSDKATPLLQLTKKDTPWNWTTEQQEAFDAIKKAFVQEVVLRTPDPEKQYFVATDTSLKGSGGVLMKKDKNGDL
jgi:hypothetical protein